MIENETKKYEVESLGIVERNHSAFMFCKSLDKIDKLEIDQWTYADFQTGAGKNTLEVIRVQ